MKRAAAFALALLLTISIADAATIFGKYRGKFTERGGFLERGDGSVTVRRSNVLKVVQFMSFGRIDTEIRLLPRGKAMTVQKINGRSYWVGRGTWRTKRTKVIFTMTLSTVDGRANLKGNATFFPGRMFLFWRMPLSKYSFKGSK